jgi:hypothetical protein
MLSFIFMHFSQSREIIKVQGVLFNITILLILNYFASDEVALPLNEK